jgi:hypothetical protein
MAAMLSMPSGPFCSLACGHSVSRRSPSIMPSTTMCATWMFCGPNSRAMLCAVARSAAFAPRERGEVLFSAQAATGTREEQAAAAVPGQHRQGSLCELKSAKRMLAPERRVEVFARLEERYHAIATSIVNCDCQRRDELGRCYKPLRIFRSGRITDGDSDRRAPAAFISVAVASSFAALRPAMTTGNPPAAKRRAMAAPSPKEDPTPTTSALPVGACGSTMAGGV